MASAVGWFPDLSVLGSKVTGSSSRLPGRPWAWFAGQPVYHTLDPPGGYQPPIRNLRSSGTGQPEPDDEVSIHRPGVPPGTLVKRTGFPDPGSKDLPEAHPGHRGIHVPGSGATRKQIRGARSTPPPKAGNADGSGLNRNLKRCRLLDPCPIRCYPNQ
jgi:hypothetical protein